MPDEEKIAIEVEVTATGATEAGNQVERVQKNIEAHEQRMAGHRARRAKQDDLSVDAQEDLVELQRQNEKIVKEAAASTAAAIARGGTPTAAAAAAATNVISSAGGGGGGVGGGGGRSGGGFGRGLSQDVIGRLPGGRYLNKALFGKGANVAALAAGGAVAALGAGAIYAGVRGYKKEKDYVLGTGDLNMSLMLLGEKFAETRDHVHELGRELGFTADQSAALTAAMRPVGTMRGSEASLLATMRATGMKPHEIAATSGLLRFGSGRTADEMALIATGLSTKGGGGYNPLTPAENIARMKQLYGLGGKMLRPKGGAAAAQISDWYQNYGGASPNLQQQQKQDWVTRNAPELMGQVLEAGKSPKSPGARMFMINSLMAQGKSYPEAIKFMEMNPDKSAQMMLGGIDAMGLSPEWREYMIGEAMGTGHGRGTEMLAEKGGMKRFFGGEGGANKLRGEGAGYVAGRIKDFKEGEGEIEIFKNVSRAEATDILKEIGKHTIKFADSVATFKEIIEHMLGRERYVDTDSPDYAGPPSSLPTTPREITPTLAPDGSREPGELPEWAQLPGQEQ